jgi:DnaJ-domain-containing protein 1
MLNSMSLTRRLQRILRAHLGDLRRDPSDDSAEPDLRGEALSSEEASPTNSDPDVPLDVAKAYRALEVPVGSGREAVKKGYRRVMKKYHQDRFRDDPDKYEVAGEVSKRLNEAHDRVLEYLDAQGA